MTIEERLHNLSTKGISMKLISKLSEVPLETIYNVSRGRLKNLSTDREERLLEAITKAEELIND